MNRILTEKDLENAVIGGSILGGGGGGSINMGLEVGKEALAAGEVRLVSIDEMDKDNILLTVSAVGAPAAKTIKVLPEDYVRTVRLYEQVTNKNADGLITNENGGTATVNGWIQSAYTGKPLIDAPCNGRAHPTGTMGSMGLHELEDYTSIQVAVGGDKKTQSHVEMVCEGSITNAAKMVRHASVAAGGLVVVARNPVSVEYVMENGAIGAISQAIKLGEIFNKGLESSIEAALQDVCVEINGEIVVQGKVKEYKIETTGGFDVGSFEVNQHEMTFWNEYMTLDNGANRLYTFPDLIMTMNLKTGFPVTSAELVEGLEVAIIATRANNLKLGSGMRDPKLLKEVESVIGKAMISYVFR